MRGNVAILTMGIETSQMMANRLISITSGLITSLSASSKSFEA
ncbi:hypothetical protein [Devosia sp. A449]